MYPIVIDPAKFSILIIGGGKIATRKAKRITAEGGHPTLISPHFSEDLLRANAQKKVTLIERPFQAGDTKDFQLIFICTNDPQANRAALNEITAQQLVNDTTNKGNSRFFTMSYFKQDIYTVAVTSEGTDPAKTKWLKDQIQLFLARFFT